MKYKNILTQIIVGATLLGFIISSLIVFYYALKNGKDIDNNALVYVLSSLTGLVGGFIAVSFGVDYKPTKEGQNHRTLKLMKLGSFSIDDSQPKKQELLGFIFALSYILIGIISVVLWVYLNNKDINSISKMATTFLGMSIPIVTNFLRTSNK